jgi:hypothetical protein
MINETQLVVGFCIACFPIAVALVLALVFGR